ncbi:hypothetical protein os1_27220 [Comamonadaceae bacterium OS-1]|nr:hypothetical protein os1_27220 [Comamonadaceae bacterium OS-1]
MGSAVGCYQIRHPARARTSRRGNGIGKSWDFLGFPRSWDYRSCGVFDTSLTGQPPVSRTCRHPGPLRFGERPGYFFSSYGPPMRLQKRLQCLPIARPRASLSACVWCLSQQSFAKGGLGVSPVRWRIEAKLKHSGAPPSSAGEKAQQLAHVRLLAVIGAPLSEIDTVPHATCGRRKSAGWPRRARALWSLPRTHCAACRT